MDERSLRAQQLDLLCLAGRNASFGRPQYDLQDGLQLVVDLLRTIRQEEVEVRRSDLRLDVELLLTEVRVRHRGVRSGHVRPRPTLPAERDVLAELHHD